MDNSAASDGTLSASLEDYLEAIFHIVERKQAARAKDIAQQMHVSNSSVTGALQALSERGLVNYAPYDIVTLTDIGTRRAKHVVRRHEALQNFFNTILGIDKSEAEEVACKTEHAVPRAVIERLTAFTDYIEARPDLLADWRAQVD